MSSISATLNQTLDIRIESALFVGNQKTNLTQKKSKVLSMAENIPSSIILTMERLFTCGFIRVRQINQKKKKRKKKREREREREQQ